VCAVCLSAHTLARSTSHAGKQSTVRSASTAAYVYSAGGWLRTVAQNGNGCSNGLLALIVLRALRALFSTTDSEICLLPSRGFNYTELITVMLGATIHRTGLTDRTGRKLPHRRLKRPLTLTQTLRQHPIVCSCRHARSGHFRRRCGDLIRPASRWGKETWPDLRLKWPQVDGGRLKHTRLDLTWLDSCMSTWVDFKRLETFRSCDEQYLRERCRYRPAVLLANHEVFYSFGRHLFCHFVKKVHTVS